MVDYALAFYLIMLGGALAAFFFYLGYLAGKHNILDKRVDVRKRKDRT